MPASSTPPRASSAAEFPGLAGALALPAALWLAIVVAGLALRPLLPIDETRYLSVAWGMFQGGHFLVPHLNGAPYSDKPPVLFWSINALWSVFGVSGLAGRLVAPLYGLGCVWMVARLARRLWPDDPATARAAPLVFAGTGAFAVYASLTMFDLPLTFFVLVAIEAILAARGGGWMPWVVCGAAMGLGVLTKGPVACLHILSVALLAPLWKVGGGPRSWGRWYAGSGLAVAVAAAVGLAWAVPAALAGGEAYGHALFWGQTADRMVKSFAHRRPVWWYLPLVPALAFPWALFPPAWRAALRAGWRGDAGLRLCAIWLVAPFVVFSLVSGKQAHYLVPEIPALALLAARLLTSARAGARRWDAWLPAAIALLIGVAVIAIASGAVVLPGRAAGWATKLSAGIGVALVAGALALALVGATWPRTRIAALAAFTALLSVLASAQVALTLAPTLDLGPPAAYLARAAAAGRPLAHAPGYEGEFGFLARLNQPFAIVAGDDAAAWARAHSNGLYVTNVSGRDLPLARKPEAIFPFRDKQVAMWSAPAVAAAGGVMSGTR